MPNNINPVNPANPHRLVHDRPVEDIIREEIIRRQNLIIGYESFSSVPTVPDPFNDARFIERDECRSVIDPYHPMNNPNNRHRESNSTYTFRQRQTKLNLTLGWELEANHTPRSVPAGIERIGDGSVNGEGAEFVVMPAITKSPRYVLGLLKDLVHAPRLNTDDSCGFHVHVSASNISSLARMRQWAIATEHLAMQIEDSAFIAVPKSRQGNTYCRRIVPLQHGTSFQSHKYNNDRRYHWLNTVEMFRPGGIRTIEVRLLGNTHRWKYLLAWSLFCMELARRGWDVANKPFNVVEHVDFLNKILIKIAEDIKPLEKKSEPVPQWVYDGLKSFGIEENAFERPLARLSETEANVRGLFIPTYSDNQPDVPNQRNEDEDEDNSCPCGCGDEDGRCEQQIHDDGDCNNNFCELCHDNDSCDGLPSCENCISRAHNNGRDCQRSHCFSCHPPRRVTIPPTIDGLTISGLTAGRMPVTSIPSPTPVSTSTNRTIIIDPSIEAEINRLHNIVVDNNHLQHVAYSMINDATTYGTGIGQVVWDEAGTSSRWVGHDNIAIGESPIDGLAMERRALNIITAPELALSLDRANNRCSSDCNMRHNLGDLCLVCGDVWDMHMYHTCPRRVGQRGRFPIGGR